MIAHQKITFACLVNKAGVVFNAAPVGKWMEGKTWKECRDYWNKRGASIIKLKWNE